MQKSGQGTDATRWEQPAPSGRSFAPGVFSARFPHHLDDMILRDFALYLTMIMSTFLVLALVFTFFELLTDIVRNQVRR